MQPNRDPYDLERFVSAQEAAYTGAYEELLRGKKLGHWIWFIFPQIEGLGSSETNKRYSIKSLSEATAFLHHPILGRRLLDCTMVVSRHKDSTAEAIFGPLDALKFRSCMTLFECATADNRPFKDALDTFFSGERDSRTLQLLSL